MASKVIKIKIGTDVHQMVDNKGEKIYQNTWISYSSCLAL